MKQTQIAFRFLAAVTLAIWAVGCAGSLHDKMNIAVAADFKVITPTKPDQQAILEKLPADKVTLIDYDGKPYYVLPDRKNNRAYVGGPKQFEEYQRLRRAQLHNSKNLEPIPVTDNRSHVHQMDWSGWGGWGGVGRYGWY